MMTRMTLACSVLLALWGCSGPDESLSDMQEDAAVGLAGGARPSGSLLPLNTEILQLRPPPNPQRNAYFGDLHVHTAYSFDAYVFGTTSTPEDAYRYARGEALDQPSGFQVQLQQPLDFYAVTDHAMFLGLVKAAADTSSEFSRYAVAEPLHNINARDNMNEWSVGLRGRTFDSFVQATLNDLLDGSIDPQVVAAAYRDGVSMGGDPTVEAFYYVRVLENPTCRWSTWDAVRAGVEPRSDLPTTIQERAWSSPIWYRSGP